MGEETGDKLVEEVAFREGVRGLRAAYEYGVGASIVPVGEGWRVSYFSGPGFAARTGTTFATLEEALVDVRGLLLAVNSEDEKAKARDLEEIVWLRLRQRLSDLE